MTIIPYLIQVTPPASQPVSLTEAKLYLRVDGADDDDVINRLIASATLAAEHYLRRSLITQTWKMAYDGSVPAGIVLMRGPIQSITDVKMIARDGAETPVNSTNYYLSADKAKLCFDVAIVSHLIEITYIAGFGEASAVPDSIKQGILMHMAQMFDNREAEVLAQSSRSLFDNYREIWI